MKTTLALAALFILVLGGGYLWKGRDSFAVDTPYVASTTAPSIEATTTNKPIATTTKTTTPGAYTHAQVATHNSSKSCWTTISGNVYDLTKWIAQHPGGEGPILGLCGNDGTSAFEGQHANNSRANAELATFKIGTLAK
ncbi:MAG: cytochrome b5-like heme/steroid binding domain-containing protein [Candidatus Paceibacterota bacterium]